MLEALRLRLFPRLRRFAALPVALCLCLGGCLDGGTEIPNEIRGTVYTESGTPAAFAEITLYSVNYTPGQASARGRVQSRADSTGRYAFKKIRAGAYNVVASGGDVFAYADSLVLKSGRVLERRDTLRRAGSVTGTVKLQPHHDPRNAIVQILGTDYYSNVSESGRFTLDDLPEGRYRLRVFTELPDYVQLFRAVTILTGVADTLPEPLEPFYDGVPVVQGLRASADSSGAIRVSWNKSAYRKTQAYLVYRDSAGSTTLSSIALRRVEDTTLLDTLYRHLPRAGQRDYFDTAALAYAYRVRIIDVSDAVGPVFGSVSATSIPPSKRHATGRWRRAAAADVFSAGEADPVKLAVHGGKLWLFRTRQRQAWSSADGVTWQLLSTLPEAGSSIAAVTSYNGTLWAITAQDGASRNGLWGSADGVNWLKLADSLPVPKRTECVFTEFQGRMWIAGGGRADASTGQAWVAVNALHSSVNGVTWTNASPNAAFKGGPFQAGAAFDGKLWMSGGAAVSSTGRLTPESHFAHSANGTAWTSPALSGDPFSWLPRGAHALAAHGGRLWAVGGEALNGPAAVASAEVWSSPDGFAWTLVDAHAPFGPRSRVSAVSFLDRLWVSGGGAGVNAAQSAEVWYLENP